jgi:hypothetical protein
MKLFTIKNARLKRWAWFFGIYLISILGLGTFMYGINFLLKLVA